MTTAAYASLPSTGSRWTPAQGEWVPSETPGFLVRPLLETPGLATWFMRVEAGAHAGSHAHDQTEQVYVVEGSFYDDAGEHAAGTFIVRRAGATHIAGSREGATLLLIYTDESA